VQPVDEGDERINLGTEFALKIQTRRQIYQAGKRSGHVSISDLHSLPQGSLGDGEDSIP
jgi:hypothetical protein